MLALVIYTLIALISPQIIRGIKVKGVWAAIGVALVFAVLNFLLGWLINGLLAIVSFPLVILTLGLFRFVLPTLANAILLKITDLFLESFELKGWLPAFIMGFLFAVGGYLASWI